MSLRIVVPAFEFQPHRILTRHCLHRGACQHPVTASSIKIATRCAKNTEVCSIFLVHPCGYAFGSLLYALLADPGQAGGDPATVGAEVNLEPGAIGGLFQQGVHIAVVGKTQDDAGLAWQ